MAPRQPNNLSNPVAAQAAIGVSRDRIVIAYERVSTDEQFRRWPGARSTPQTGPAASASSREPGGVSASKLAIFDRPGGKELCDLITAGRVEAIYV